MDVSNYVNDPSLSTSPCTASNVREAAVSGFTKIKTHWLSCETAAKIAYDWKFQFGIDSTKLKVKGFQKIKGEQGNIPGHPGPANNRDFRDSITDDI